MTSPPSVFILFYEQPLVNHKAAVKVEFQVLHKVTLFKFISIPSFLPSFLESANEKVLQRKAMALVVVMSTRGALIDGFKE